jgi:hypothetical protein
MLGGIWKSLLKTPGRNKNQDDGVTYNTSSPTRFSPNPKRQNTNRTPNKKGITKNNEELNEDLTLLDPPQLCSNSISEGIIFPAPQGLNNLRNDEKVAISRVKFLNGMDFPVGMPMGPCPTSHELFELINKWAKDRNKDNGAFSVKKHTTAQPTKYRGPTQKILCSRGGTKPCK